MDFASRHTASAPPPAAGADASSSAVTEEPEYLARYFVVKHSWRGRYRRILCIEASGVVTLDPGTLAVTNSYDFSAEFDRAAPDSNANEFTLSVRTDGKGKFKAMRFSSPLRAGILTELHRLRPVHPVVEFPVLHLRRRTQEWAPFVSSSRLPHHAFPILSPAYYSAVLLFFRNNNTWLDSNITYTFVLIQPSFWVYTTNNCITENLYLKGCIS
jgi:DnaJ family protein C protein 13